MLCACGKKEEDVLVEDQVVPVETVYVSTPTPYATAEPTDVPVQPTVEPTTAIDPERDVIITKNPSDEALNEGDKTWFIAHANNAESISWRFTDTTGTAHSVEETMAMNPGLELEVLPEDTIALRNVPLSLNGWCIQARFDGSYSSAVTEPAYINVGNFDVSYAGIINLYSNALISGIKTEGEAYDMGISPMVSLGDNVGYAYKDLDKNGIPELILAVAGDNLTEDAKDMVLAVYTLVNDEAVKLIECYPRSRIYLMTDGRIYNPGSSGAYNSSNSVYHVNVDKTVFDESVYSGMDPDNDGNVIWYYSKDEGYKEEANLKVTENEAYERISEWEAKVYLPELQLLIRK